MKNYFLLVFAMLLMSSCKNNLHSQKKNNIYQNIFKAFIDYRNSETEISKKENILIIGANTIENDENSYWLDIWFVNPKLLQDFDYSKVYEIKGYKLIIDESLNKSEILKHSFKETKYENFNLATELIDYDSKNWYIVFSSKNEVIRISPKQKSKEIKGILLKRGVKFSQEFDDD
ncbi:hypothetical protein SAMN05444360_101452 [Chryseobacterium carnipullorum]|uniref:hypothetical protein n=1 Tax=Chryseobacterium carnipullorum TaxID=1124835 RepID=UPI00091F75DD|nr:hypothetical protein [Chryseobacterium carnipullorum]SHL41388.1 hypothetical protein SAMN05444360_101452 [Chryseobacterium carnipullorum]